MEKKFLTTGEVARRCGVSACTVKRWVDIGYLPGYKFGCSYRIDENDVVALMQRSYKRRTTSSTASNVK